MIDLNLVDLIADSAGLRKTDVVLEVGTGVGSLTSRLSDRAGAVLSVEIDANLHQLASEELEGRANVRLIHGDALRNKNALRDDLMGQIRDAIARIGDEARFLLVANLPYNVATPIVSNLLLETPPPDGMVVTIQKEMGDRIVASPGSKDYGALRCLDFSRFVIVRLCGCCRQPFSGRGPKFSRRFYGLIWRLNDALLSPT